jgi:hypothetical protein
MRMEWSIIVGWIMPFLIFLIFIFLIVAKIMSDYTTFYSYNYTMIGLVDFYKFKKGVNK